MKALHDKPQASTSVGNPHYIVKSPTFTVVIIFTITVRIDVRYSLIKHHALEAQGE